MYKSLACIIALGVLVLDNWQLAIMAGIFGLLAIAEAIEEKK